MILSGSTLLAIAFLIVAASLASYLFRQWPPFRGAERTVSWMALSLGTTLFLVAASAVVLFSGVLPIDWLTERLGLLQSMMGHSQSEPLSNWPPEPSMREVSRTPAHDVAVEFTSSAGTITRSGVPGDFSGYSGTADNGYVTPTPQSTSHREAAENSTTLQVPGLVGTTRDAWDATRCIVSYRPDPSDPTRWFLENDCGAPVAVLVAACEHRVSEQDDCPSGLWRYRKGGMILPAKHQRSVTYAEQTQLGTSIRYIGCIVEQPWAVNLIGQGLAVFSTAGLEATQPSDPCLARVQHLAEAGSTFTASMDVLVGGARSGEE